MSQSLRLKLFFPEASLQTVRRFNKRKTFKDKNRLVRLADILLVNLTKSKSPKNTNLNREYSFINFWYFLASDVKVDGWVGLYL